MEKEFKAWIWTVFLLSLFNGVIMAVTGIPFFILVAVETCFFNYLKNIIKTHLN